MLFLIQYSKLKNSSPAAKVLVHKLNHRPEFELYNLKTDPYELKNEFDNPEYKDTAEKMKKALLTKLAELGDYDPISTEKSLVKGNNKKKLKKK